MANLPASYLSDMKIREVLNVVRGYRVIDFNRRISIVAFLLIFWKFDKSLGLLPEAVNHNTTAVQLLLQKEEKEKNNLMEKKYC